MPYSSQYSTELWEKKSLAFSSSSLQDQKIQKVDCCHIKRYCCVRKMQSRVFLIYGSLKSFSAFIVCSNRSLRRFGEGHPGTCPGELASILLQRWGVFIGVCWSATGSADQACSSQGCKTERSQKEPRFRDALPYKQHPRMESRRAWAGWARTHSLNAACAQHEHLDQLLGAFQILETKWKLLLFHSRHGLCSSFSQPRHNLQKSLWWAFLQEVLDLLWESQKNDVVQSASSWEHDVNVEPPIFVLQATPPAEVYNDATVQCQALAWIGGAHHAMRQWKLPTHDLQVMRLFSDLDVNIERRAGNFHKNQRLCFFSRKLRTGHRRGGRFHECLAVCTGATAIFCI